MSNHPNRKQIRFPANRLAGISGPPDPTSVLGERINAGITQQQAAEMLYTDIRTYQRWEYGDSRMHPAIWALFLIRTNRLTTKKRSDNQVREK